MNNTFETLEIDFSNDTQLCEIMEIYGEKFDQMIFGENSEGEDYHISINSDHIVRETFRKITGFARKSTSMM